MRIVNEQYQDISNPDLSQGYLYEKEIVKIHHPKIPEQLEQGHYEQYRYLEDEDRDMSYWRVDTPYRPASPAWDEYETVQVYHRYTTEELEERDKPTEDEILAEQIIDLALM